MFQVRKNNQETPDSVEALRKAVGDLRSSFSDYELAWISLMHFTVHASLPEHQEERQTVEAMMRTRKELVKAAINEGWAGKMTSYWH